MLVAGDTIVRRGHGVDCCLELVHFLWHRFRCVTGSDRPAEGRRLCPGRVPHGRGRSNRGLGSGAFIDGGECLLCWSSVGGSLADEACAIGQGPGRPLAAVISRPSPALQDQRSRRCQPLAGWLVGSGVLAACSKTAAPW